MQLIHQYIFKLSNWFWLAHSQIFYPTPHMVCPSSTVFCVRTFCVIAVVLLYVICTCWDHWNRHTCNTPIVQKEWGYGAAISPVVHRIFIDIIINIYISVSYPYLHPPLLLLWCTRSAHVKITNVQYACHNINGPGINGPGGPFWQHRWSGGTIYAVKLDGPGGPSSFIDEWSMHEILMSKIMTNRS